MKRGLASPSVHSAFATTRRSRVQLSRVVQSNDLKRRAGRASALWDVHTGSELASFAHGFWVRSAVFSPDGARVVTVRRDGRISLWDVTWAARLTGSALVRAVARTRLTNAGVLTGASRLTDEEVRALRPLLGDDHPVILSRDVVSRWLKPSTDDAEVETILTQWLRHREMALYLAKIDWAYRAAEIDADLSERHAERAKAPAISSLAAADARARTSTPLVSNAVTDSAAAQTTATAFQSAQTRRGRARLAKATLVLFLLLAFLVGLAATDRIDVVGVIRHLFPAVPR